MPGQGGRAGGDKDTVILRACTLYLREFGEVGVEREVCEKAERDAGWYLTLLGWSWGGSAGRKASRRTK